MSKVKKLRNEIKSKIEVIKKINDNPKLAVDDLYDLYGDGVTNVDKLLQSKVDGLKSKLKRKKDNKTDIFGSVIDVASGFLNNKSKDIVVNDKLISGNKIKKYALDSAKITVEDSKNIVMDAVKKVLFVDDETSICGVDTPIPNDAMSISPKEFDFLEVLQNEPTSKIGQIMYENPNSTTGDVKMNREFYGAFDTNYTFSSKSGQSLFDLQWNATNQEYDISGLKQGGLDIKFADWIDDYYDTVEIPNLEYITKTAMLMTLQGDGDNPQVFDKALNDLNRLCSKLFKICGSPTEDSGLIQTTSQQFNENDQDVESYFDFNDVEGIDIDDEDARYRKVLKFVDCGNFEVPSSESNFEDFVYLSNNQDLASLVNSTIEKAARNAAISSDNQQHIDNIQLEIINLFVLNVPKALVSSVVSPKFIFPVVVAWKQLKGFIGDVKELLKKLSKLFFTIIKDVFWKFIQEFWKMIKRDLLSFIAEVAMRIILNRFKRYRTILLALIKIIRKIISRGIKSCLELFQTIIDVVNGALNARGPVINIPGFILGFADLLPGYSADRAFMGASERLASEGLNVGTIYGDQNEYLTFAKSLIDGITEENDTNGFVKGSNKLTTIPTPVGPIVIPPGIINIAGKTF